jgi:hypothetical protein
VGGTSTGASGYTYPHIYGYIPPPWPSAFCIDCATALNCLANATTGYTCTSTSAACTCKDKVNMIPSLGCACVSGLSLVGGVCLGCNDAHSCYLPGTAYCDQSRGCICATGFTGPTCGTCQPNYLARRTTGALTCTLCTTVSSGAACANFGVVACAKSTAAGQASACRCVNVCYLTFVSCFRI